MSCLELIPRQKIMRYLQPSEVGGKKRINRVFDAIGFVYPDYHYPLWGQGKKRKVAALAAPAEPVTKAAGKKIKVLTHWPCYINRMWCLSLAGRPLQLLNQEKLFLPCRGLKSRL
jgi:hypothetical protein